ncbi:MAG: hypothetical protein KDB27_02970 [Planctomycetales bacterium]|nr:hypothetical protein [Planctomycetales bacterium]
MTTTYQKNGTQASVATTATQWTRVDLLLALYDRTISTLETLAESLQTQGVSAIRYQTRAMFLLEQIIDGIDAEQCDYASEIMRLCEFAFRAINNRNTEAIEKSAAAFRTIREGFATVRDDAVAMEMRGDIPSVNATIEEEA